MKYYHIDSFTLEAFKGNSAGVVICKGTDIEDDIKQSLASEFKHSETAFVFINQSNISLRWFTPIREVDLCGHATIAAAYALWDSGLVNKMEQIKFSTKSGILTALNSNNKIELDFPQLFVDVCESNELLNKSLNIEPIFTAKNDKRYLVEIDNPEELRNIKPDFNLLNKVELGAFILTCKSDRPGFDFLSRFFAPYVGINEDPVTGSAHCYLAPYWANKLQKRVLVGFQESNRTGIIECEVLNNNRVKLRGNAKKLFSTELEI
jgi:PhzF family phenazine biosynthesis protein